MNIDGAHSRSSLSPTKAQISEGSKEFGQVEMKEFGAKDYLRVPNEVAQDETKEYGSNDSARVLMPHIPGSSLGSEVFELAEIKESGIKLRPRKPGPSRLMFSVSSNESCNDSFDDTQSNGPGPDGDFHCSSSGSTTRPLRIPEVFRVHLNEAKYNITNFIEANKIHDTDTRQRMKTLSLRWFADKFKTQATKILILKHIPGIV
jgi:hypothetical protein